jgi:hypothetical protein
VLLLIAGVTTTLLPMLWLTTRLFTFAEYSLYPIPYWASGCGCFIVHTSIWAENGSARGGVLFLELSSRAISLP